MTRRRHIPEDVVELAQLLSELPVETRDYFARTIRVAAGIKDIDESPILSRLLSERPRGPRYKAYERRVREAQRKSRRRGK